MYMYLPGMYEVALILIIILVSFVIPAYISYRIALYKGLPPLRWVVLTIILSWPIMIALAFFPKIKKNDLSGEPRETPLTY